MEFKAYIKNLKISPKKLRFLLPEVKKLKPAEALTKLYYTNKKSAQFLYKAIKSAVDNAKNVSKINEDLLRFKLLTVEEGSRLKRYQPGGRGGVKPYVHRLSHIKIILEGEEPKNNQTKTIKENKNLEIKSKKNKKYGSKS